jgi:hypothetical protein
MKRKTRLIASYWRVFQQKVVALQAFLFVRRVMLRSHNISRLIINQLIDALTAEQMKLFCIFSNENRQN